MLSLRYPGVFAIALVVALELGGIVTVPPQSNSKTRDVTNTAESQAPLAPTHGGYYALVIGIDNYGSALPHLETPESDAKAVAELLTGKFGFQTTLLLGNDATHDLIIQALERYSSTLKEDDNLLIYFGGHGNYTETHLAYWAPADAGKDSYARWIIAAQILGDAAGARARQVLIVSDSCYSGMLSQARSGSPALPSGDHAAYVDKMLHKRSRHLMASGGKEPVLDNDGSGHSVFANVFLSSLKEYPENEFTAGQLFIQIQELVGQRASQTPQYNVIIDPRNDDGDFVFFRTVPGPKTSVSTIVETEEEDKHRLVNPDEEAVFAALDRYASAFSSMDIGNLKQVWPSMTKPQESETRRAWNLPGLKAVIVEFRNRRMIKIEGSTAVVNADEWMEYTYFGRQRPPQTNSVEIQLAKSAQGFWLVSGKRGR
jgi:hypothetical protein